MRGPRSSWHSSMSSPPTASDPVGGAGRLRARHAVRVAAARARRAGDAQRDRRCRERRADGVPAGDPSPAAGGDRLPRLVPAPRGFDLLVHRRRGPGSRAGRACCGPCRLELVPESDRSRPRAGRLLSLLPRSGGSRRPAGGRRLPRSRRVLRVPKRAVLGPGPHADVPPARARSLRLARPRRRLASEVVRPGGRAAPGARARRRRRRGFGSVLRPHRPHARPQPALPGPQVRGRCPDRRRGADGRRLVQLPPGAFLGALRHHPLGRWRGAHGVCRLRAGADHARDAVRARLRPGKRGRPRSGCSSSRLRRSA